MRIFIGPADIGPRAYQLILPALLAGRQVIVWRPSLQIIQNLYDKGELLLSGSNFLELVERGEIVVAARENWYEGRRAREKVPHWASSPWVDGLDDALALIALREDSSKLLLSKRAIPVAPSEGVRWAKQIAQRNPRYVEGALDLLERRKLPSGYLTRAIAAENSTDAALSILRDARNTALSIEEAGADIPLHPGSYGAEIAALGGRRLSLGGDHQGLDTLDRFMDAMYLSSKF